MLANLEVLRIPCVWFCLVQSIHFYKLMKFTSMCLHKGRKMSSCLELRHSIIACGFARAQTSPGGFKMQGERGVARVGAGVQNKLPQLALNFHNNSPCCLKQRKILVTVSILLEESWRETLFFPSLRRILY